MGGFYIPLDTYTQFSYINIFTTPWDMIIKNKKKKPHKTKVKYEMTKKKIRFIHLINFNYKI